MGGEGSCAVCPENETPTASSEVGQPTTPQPTMECGERRKLPKQGPGGTEPVLKTNLVHFSLTEHF